VSLLLPSLSRQVEGDILGCVFLLILSISTRSPLPGNPVSSSSNLDSLAFFVYIVPAVLLSA